MLLFPFYYLTLLGINVGTFITGSEKEGLSFEPQPDRGSLIWYKSQETDSFQKYTNKLDEYLTAYRTIDLLSGRGQNIIQCDHNVKPSDDQLCNVDVKHWVPCVQENNYGYHKSAPCIFLNFNLSSSWVPDYFNHSDALPADMPDDLKAKIQQLKNSSDWRNRAKINTLWVTCEGELPADQENIGPIQYIPTRGFPGYYFPYKQQQGYLLPLVAIHFERPARGVLISIKCKAWARNIKHDESNIGTTYFELLID